MLLARVGCSPLTLDADSLSELDQGHACPNGSQTDPLALDAILSKSDETLRVQLFAPNEPDADVDFIVYTGSRLIFSDDNLCDDSVRIGLFYRTSTSGMTSWKGPRQSSSTARTCGLSFTALS